MKNIKKNKKNLLEKKENKFKYKIIILLKL